MLPPTGADAVGDGCAVGGLRPCSPADGAEAEGIASSGEQSSQDSAARRPAVVRVDDGQPVCRSPLQVKVIIVGAHRAAPCDLHRGVSDSSKQEGGGRSGS